MRRNCVSVLLAVQAGLAYGQLTMEQKIDDFQYMAGVYAKNYAPYDWKRVYLGYDALNAAPWLDKIRATKDDLDFYEVMSEYVASLNDAHDAFSLPSTFIARLNFGVDIYDGKLLVDSINRTRLPASEFGFANGWELVSIDGADANKLLDSLMRYEIAANERSTRRFAATLLTTRPQQLMPHAATNLPETGVVVFRRPDGVLETFRIPWAKSGLPLVSVGRYPSPRVKRAAAHLEDDTDQPILEEQPDYLLPLKDLLNCRIADRAVLNFGSRTPIFSPSMPLGFVQRLGTSGADEFFSGTFQSGGFRIGFIRIPSYAPANQTAALNQFAAEMIYFQQNTDGVIVDEMRNPGGSLNYTNQLLSFLMPRPWDSIGFEVRATSFWVAQISSAFEQVKALGFPKNIVDLYQSLRDELIAANHEQRAITRPIPLDDVKIDRAPAVDSSGRVIAYNKPVMVLIDELSASGADYFAATIQDNARGPLFGWRTMGAGGSVVGADAGSYSLGGVGLTLSLMSRKKQVTVPGYPATNYVENVGVHPDIQADYMTVDNLTNSGKTFVDTFVAAMVEHIRKNK